MAEKTEAVVLVFQTLLICGLVNGMFESTLGMLRGFLIQTVILYVLLRSTRGAPAAQNGAVYRFLTAVGYGCQVYMMAKLLFFY
ncbi:hypothetical protein CASFOL_020663 [Castilleja foliolosa]|uniref:Uncharacterized protein n=1 Tax=Castilleja foliolosa TaxID=1961234 RepID=A0ABD3D541_9LAMI